MCLKIPRHFYFLQCSLFIFDNNNNWSFNPFSPSQLMSNIALTPTGLKAESICPSAGSSETLTLSIRRPNRSGPQSSGRGVLSMSGLSYGVVRVDQENSLTSLTLQDVGQVLIMIFPTYSFQSSYWLLIFAQSLSINSISVFLLSF